MKVTCSAWLDSWPPIRESRPGPRRSAGSTQGLDGEGGEPVRGRASHACQAVSAPGTAHSPSSVCDEQPPAGGPHLVAAQRPEPGHRGRPGEGERAPGDRAQVLRVLAAQLGERPEVERRRIGLGRRPPRAARPRRTGRPCCRGRRSPASSPRAAAIGSSPVSARSSGPRSSSRAASASRRHCASYPAGAVQPAPGAGRGRGRHLGQRLLPPTSHDRILPLSPTKMRLEFVVTCRRDAPPPSGRHRSNRGSRRGRADRDQ